MGGKIRARDKGFCGFEAPRGTRVVSNLATSGRSEATRGTSSSAEGRSAPLISIKIKPNQTNHDHPKSTKTHSSGSEELKRKARATGSGTQRSSRARRKSSRATEKRSFDGKKGRRPASPRSRLRSRRRNPVSVHAEADRADTRGLEYSTRH